MVYLSELTLDPHNRYTGRLIGDSYELHRYLMKAYPDIADGGAGRVLYRVEIMKHHPRLLVQSEREPDWERLLPQPISCRGPKPWEPAFQTGQLLRFRLRANATRCSEGKRHLLRTREAQAAWLERKGGQHGFELIPLPTGSDWFDAFDDDIEPKVEVRMARSPLTIGHKPHTDDGASLNLTHRGVDFDGALRVVNPEAFSAAIAAGIGPAKAFGFGLLSLAPMSG